MEQTRSAVAAPGLSGVTPQRLGQWLLGSVLFSIGVKCFIDSGLGTDPLHAMIIGVVDTLDIPFVRIGVVELGVVVVSLAVWCVWNRCFPVVTVISVFLTMAIVGFLIDVWDYIRLETLTSHFGNRWVLSGIGLVLDAYASALIIMAGFGIRSMDLLAISFVHRLGWPFVAGKMLFEVGFCAVAWLTGGPVGVATVLFVLIVGLLIQPFMALNGRLLTMENHGLATQA